MNNSVIYLIKNELNGKKYVGQTRVGIKKRFEAHCQGAKTPLDKAIKKYGKRNFSVEVLEKAEKDELLDELELKWMVELNTFAPEGYNVSPAISPWDRMSGAKKRRIIKKWSERGKLQAMVVNDMRKLWQTKWKEEDPSFYHREALEWDEKWLDYEELKRLYEFNIKKFTDHELDYFAFDIYHRDNFPWVTL